ncbi:MAG: MFS transporter [Chloroflexi bacterium]|nr:MFS transporter [Chloroflexota bacterium]
MTALRSFYGRYPNQFWLLMFGMFIDRTGGFMLFTFFTLYITQHFNVGMTEAGIVLLLFSATGLVSGTIGGALVDRFGRKWVVIFGLVVTATSSLTMAFIDDLTLFYIVAAGLGLLSGIGGPAVGAMVADMLPEEKHADGFAMLRVVINVSAMVGPSVGAILAAGSFMYLFFGDAVTSVITAGVLVAFLAETRPQPVEGEEHQQETFLQTLRGYGTVITDRPFVMFALMMLLVEVVYIQMYSTLPVFLRDFREFPGEAYGYIMSMNAVMVVTMQFGTTVLAKRYPPMLMMAVGGVFLAIGFGLYGFVHATILFFVAMAVVTIGEMIIFPTAQALVAKLAPAHMRGRYMGLFEMSFLIANMLGPLMAGIIMDDYHANYVWYVGAVLAVLSAIGFVVLYSQVRSDQNADEKAGASVSGEVAGAV